MDQFLWVKCLDCLDWNGLFWCLEDGLSWGQSEPAPTSGPTWMDGVLIGLSFLSLSHPRLTVFVCLFSALISVDFSFFCNFIFSSPCTRFLFFLLLKLFPLSPTDLLTYVLFPIYLLTYKFKMCYFHLHLHGYTYLHGCRYNTPPTFDNDGERIK